MAHRPIACQTKKMACSSWR